MIELNKKSFIKIVKYVFSAGSSFALDLVVFTIFNLLIKNIFISTIIARVISSLYNYLMNSRFVFKSYSKSSIYKYYILVVIQMFVSATTVSILSYVFKDLNDTIIKIFVDIIIFIINYFVQKEVVFK